MLIINKTQNMAKDSFPSSTLFHHPILVVLSDGLEHTQKEFIDKVIKALRISKEDQNKKTDSGRNKVASWVGQAVRNLMGANLITTPQKRSGKYLITEAGKQLLAIKPNGFKGGPAETSLLPLMAKLGVSPDGTKPIPEPELQPHPSPSTDEV